MYICIFLYVPFSCKFCAWKNWSYNTCGAGLITLVELVLLHTWSPSYYTRGALKRGGGCRASIAHAWSRRVDACMRFFMRFFVRIFVCVSCTRFCTRFCTHFLRVFVGVFVRVFVRFFLYAFFLRFFCTSFCMHFLYAFQKKN